MVKQKMGRNITAVCLTLIVLAAGFAACSTGGSGRSGQEIYDTLAAQLPEKMQFEEELALVDLETACLNYGIAQDKVSAATQYIGSAAHVDEFSMFLAAEEADVAAIKAAAEKRIADQKEMYSNYNTEELPKLDDPILFTKDHLVVLCIGGDEATIAYLKEVLQ